MPDVQVRDSALCCSQSPGTQLFSNFTNGADSTRLAGVLSVEGCCKVRLGVRGTKSQKKDSYMF